MKYGILLCLAAALAGCGGTVIEKDVDPNSEVNGEPDIYMYIRAGDVGAVKKLLAKDPARANYQDTYIGQTALHRAVVFKQTEIVKVLLENGAQVNATGSTSQTPLALAEEVGAPDELIQVLRDNGGTP